MGWPMRARVFSAVLIMTLVCTFDVVAQPRFPAIPDALVEVLDQPTAQVAPRTISPGEIALRIRLRSGPAVGLGGAADAYGSAGQLLLPVYWQGELLYCATESPDSAFCVQDSDNDGFADQLFPGVRAGASRIQPISIGAPHSLATPVRLDTASDAPVFQEDLIYIYRGLQASSVVGSLRGLEGGRQAVFQIGLFAPAEPGAPARGVDLGFVFFSVLPGSEVGLEADQGVTTATITWSGRGDDLQITNVTPLRPGAKRLSEVTSLQ